jgi:hypothetical protein
MAMTAEQNASIADMWSKIQNDPKAVMKAMTDYGIGAQDLATATGQSMQQVGGYLQNNGAQSGFGGYNYNMTNGQPSTPADIATGNYSNIGAGSAYTDSVNKPAPTNFAEYTAQTTAPATDPTVAVVKGSSTPYTQSEWNSQQARIADEKKRGITFGGGSSPSQGGVVNSAAGSIGVTTAASPDITARIKADMAGLKTQADLNRYFATSGYTAEQLAAAMPQYGSAADYKNAMALGVAEYGKTQSNGILGSNTTSASSANGVTPWNVTKEGL